MSQGAFVFCLSLLAAPGLAQEEEVPFEEPRDVFAFHTVWDLRYVRTDDATGWLGAGLGKTRYGGEGGEPRDLFRLPLAAFVVDLEPLSNLTVHAHVNLDLEPEHPEGRYGWDRLRVIELFGDWRIPLGDDYEIGVKGGTFFPPISLEHVGEAWTSPFTLTPSAINAWVGEEVKTTGAELALVRIGLENELSARGAIFWNDDPTGSLLAYRGFTLHDRQTGYRDRLPLPPTPSIQPGGTFATQAPFVEPMREIDDHAGYYAALAWDRYQSFRVSGLYFDNLGEPTAFDGEQYAWATRFANVGVAVFLPGEAELFGQLLDGDTLMGLEGPSGMRVEADYRSWYALLTAPFGGRHRVSLRYDDFRIQDRDPLDVPDGSDEDGDAWTVAYSLVLGGEHRLFAELLRVASSRPARVSLGEPADVTELSFQLGLRLAF